MIIINNILRAATRKLQTVNWLLQTLLCLLLTAPCQLASAQSPQEDSTWLLTHYTKKEVSIPVRDGIRLFTAIYTPIDNSTPHPILLNRTPYSIAPYGPAYKAFWNTPYMAYFKDN